MISNTIEFMDWGRIRIGGEFWKKFKHADHINQVGDRTSLKADTKLEKGENFFTIITKYLKDYHPTVKLQSKNPSVAQSGKFINEIYEGASASGITIGINSKCKLSIFDYTYALEDSDGTMLKSKKKNPITKVTYEEFGHASDAKRYLITHAFEGQYNQFLNLKKPSIGVLNRIK